MLYLRPTNMKLNDFKKSIFIAWTIVFGLLLIPCLIAAAAEDEGTLGTSLFWVTLADLFYFFRFPTHTLFWFVFSLHPVLWLSGLVINCMFYGLIVERIFFLSRLKRHKREANHQDTLIEPL